MPDCTPFQKTVDQLKAELVECNELEDPILRTKCRSATQKKLDQATEALKNCQAGLPPVGSQRATGQVSFLRVNEGGFGPPDDFLASDVIVKLNTAPTRAFGITLDTPAREGMLALLRDAFVGSIRVNIDYRQVAGRANSVAFRVELTR